MMKSQNGFTLLEIMIALAIMAVLSLLTTQALQSAIDSRAFVSRELNRDAQMADTLRILRADISKAFHYQDIFCKMNQELKPTPIPGVQPVPTETKCPPETTGFIGDGESLYFTSLSNVRTLRDSQESSQAKIGYYVKSCRAQNAKGPTKCLYRSLSPVLDQEIDKPGPATLLVENVESFKLRYLGPGREEFVDSWKTGKNGDDLTKDKFPYAVEVTLTIHDKNNPKDRPETQTALIPLNFENNPKKKPAPGTSPGQGQGQPPGPGLPFGGGGGNR